MSGWRKVTLGLAGLALAGLLGVCGIAAGLLPEALAFSSGKPDSPPVELTYYYMVYEIPEDQDRIAQAVNAYIAPRLQATVRLMPVMESRYKDRINALLAGNEAFDLLWTADWGSGDYADKARKGGLLPLDGLLPAAPLLREAIPATFWEDVREAGAIYAVPNVQIAAKAEGFVIQKRLIDKYHIEVSRITSWQDIEPVLRIIRENEPDMIPIASTGNMFDYGRAYGYTAQGYKLGDPDYTVVNNLDKPEYRAFLDTVRRWYLAGYIYKDSASLGDAMLVSLLRTGKVAVEWNTTMKPGGEAEDRERFGGNEVVYVRLSEPELTGVRSTMTAVSRTSRHPQKALELIELLETDPALYNLLAFGIEDRHYTKLGGNTIRIRQEGGYKADIGWVFGNVLIGYVKEGQPADTLETISRLNEHARRPEVYGFRFDSGAYQTEETGLNLAALRYAKALQNGAVEPDAVFPQYYEAALKAGLRKQTEEKQKQLDRWLIAQGKKKPVAAGRK